MFDHKQHLVNQERLKDLQREAENERLARSAARNDNDLLKAVRNVVGNSLVKVGQQMLDEKQR
jgi:hypothetical protein